MEKYALLVLVAYASVGCGFKILVVFPVASNSHANLGDGVVRNLLRAGHEVTYITPFPAKSATPKLRSIVVDNTKTVFREKSLNLNVLMKKEAEMNYQHLFHTMYNISKVMLEHQEVKKLMNDPREHFDVIIAEWMFNSIYSGFSSVFNCPFIWLLSFEPNFITLSLIDEATNPAYTADVWFGYEPPFTFMQRVEVLWSQFIHTVTFSYYYHNTERALYETVFQEAVTSKRRVLPPYDDIRLNASLTLGNTHVSYGTKIRLPQNFKSIGGYHIDPDVSPLPADLKKIIDDSKHGVIYFSMGSSLESKDFSDEIKKSLLEMFGTLKQTVLWKFEGSFSNIPKNVHIMKWAPQPSILAHPNCILFITHGGLLSIIEAINFGVPIIGIPVYFDQYHNIERAVQRGYGKKVMLSHNVDIDLKLAIREVAGNSQYKEKMKEISFIYHLRPMTPAQELCYWVEYVVATRGADHLRSPALRVPLHQKMYLDLIAVFVLAFFIIKKYIIFQIVINKRNKKKNS